MRYLILGQQAFRSGEYEIVPIREKDIDQIKRWRNEQIDVLRQPRELSDEDQRRYWNQVLLPSFEEKRPRQILFSYLFQGHCIGYGGLTHIDWDAKRAEVSFLLDTKRGQNVDIYQKEFAIFLSLLKILAFEELKMHRIFTETFSVRPQHIAVLEDCGFTHEGTLKDHVKVGDHYQDSLIHGMVNEQVLS